MSRSRVDLHQPYLPRSAFGVGVEAALDLNDGNGNLRREAGSRRLARNIVTVAARVSRLKLTVCPSYFGRDRGVVCGSHVARSRHAQGAHQFRQPRQPHRKYANGHDKVSRGANQTGGNVSSHPNYGEWSRAGQRIYGARTAILTWLVWRSQP